MTELIFSLDVNDDDWPPVAKECLICADTESGYRIEVPPFFVKDLSVGDVIAVERDDLGEVVAWSHVEKSKRSTIWVMTYGDYSIEGAIDCLKRIGCNIERFTEYRYFSVDVPSDCSVEQIDECLDKIDEKSSALAFPSFRHEVRPQDGSSVEE